MSYITRERLIHLIMEDMWEGDDGKIYSTAQDHDPEMGDPVYHHAPKKEAKNRPLHYLFPTPAESIAGAPTASDKQQAQIVIVSQFLTEFGILNGPIKTKKLAYDDEDDSGSKKKALQDLQNLFGVAPGDAAVAKGAGKPVFPPGTPIEMVMHVIANSATELEKIYKVQFNILLGKDVDKLASGNERDVTWEDYLKVDPRTAKDPKLQKIFPQGFNPRLMGAIKQYLELVGKGSSDLNSIYKLVYDYLKDVYASKKYKTPAAFAARVDKNEKIRLRLEEGELGKYFRKAMSSASIDSVDKLNEYISSAIQGGIKGGFKERKKILGDKMKVINWRLARKLPEYRQYLRNFPAFIDHLHKTNRFRYNELLNNYNMTDEELKEFKTFEDFSRYVFTKPELMGEIYRRANVEERARSKDEVRQGNAISVNLRSLENQLERGGRGRKGSSIEEKREQIEAMREEIAADKETMAMIKKEASATSDPAEKAKLKAKYDELKAKTAKAGRKVSSILHSINSKLSKNPEAEFETREEKEAERREAIQAKIHDIIASTVSNIDDPNKLEFFLNKYDKRGEHMAKIKDGGAGDADVSRLVTMFDILVPASVTDGAKGFKKELLTYFGATCEKLEKKLNKEEVKNGKEGLTDVYINPKSVGRDMVVTIEIEYSNKAYFAKRVKRNGVEDIIELILKPFPKASGIRAKGVAKINQKPEY